MYVVSLSRYAPLLAPKFAEGYDLVIIQLYEGFSRAGHEIFDQKVHPTDYLAALAHDCSSGWTVKLEGGDTRIYVPPSKLVIGLANGWGERAAESTPLALSCRSPLRSLARWLSGPL